MSTYQQPTLSNFRAEKGYYTTREIAEIYHVSPQTVCNWLKVGRLQGEMREPVSEADDAYFLSVLKTLNSIAMR